MKNKTLFVLFSLLFLTFIFLVFKGHDFFEFIFINLGFITKNKFDSETVKIYQTLNKSILNPIFDYFFSLLNFFKSYRLETFFSKIIYFGFLIISLFATAALSGLFFLRTNLNVFFLEVCRIIFFLTGYILIFDASIFFLPYKTMFLMSAWSLLMHINFYFSYKQDIIFRSLNQKVDSNFEFLNLEFLKILFKRVVALMAFLLAIFFFARTVLIYNNTTVKKVLIRALR